MYQISLALLPKENKRVLVLIGKKLGAKIRLSGGTALMLQLGHRRSYDLDFFSLKSLTVSYLERKLMETLGKDLRLLFASSDQINMEWQNIHISIIYFPFSPLKKILHTSGVNITNLRDIASEKAFSIGRREEWRDYVDLYAVLKSGKLTLEHILSDCQKRFGNGFSSRLFLNQLSAVAEVPVQPIDWLWKEPEPKVIHKFFMKIVRSKIEKEIK